MVFTLSASTQYSITFSGALAPPTPNALTFTTPASGSTLSLTVPNYVSPNPGENQLAVEQTLLWPSQWFSPSAKTVGGVAYAVALAGASLLASVGYEIGEIYNAERLQSCQGSLIDSFAADYFGGALPRNSGETDAAYILRIEANLAAKKGTLAGIITIGNFYGTTTIFEDWNAAQTGGFDLPTLSFDGLGGLGIQRPQLQVFIETASAMSSATIQEATLAILGARPAGVFLQLYNVVGTTATLLFEG